MPKEEIGDSGRKVPSRTMLRRSATRWQLSPRHASFRCFSVQSTPPGEEEKPASGPLKGIKVGVLGCRQSIDRE